MKQIKCIQCKENNVWIDSDPECPKVCTICFVQILKESPLLNCNEKGHSHVCKCPENPLNEKFEQDSKEYVSPTVTAADFPEPGKTVDEFLKSIEDEKNRKRLTDFFTLLIEIDQRNKR